MLMEEVFGKLQEYQGILTRRVEIEREIDEIPRALETQTELLSRIKKTYAEKHQEFEATEAKVRELKGSLAEAEGSREHAEKAMDGITTQREYEALNKEIRDSGDKEQSYRKDLQREERSLAEAEEELRKYESMIQSQESEIAEKTAKVNLDTTEKRNEIASLRDEEKKASEGIDSDVIFKFERIIRNKQGLGIVPVRGVVCTGCHMILPAHFVNEVRQGNKIIFCPYCSRVLFHQETPEDAGDVLSEIESGSLSDLEDYIGEGEEEAVDENDDDQDKDSRDDSREDSDD
ncbi:MAG: C4-type zinc ribbon domain-containing protein [Rectinema sp.]